MHGLIGPPLFGRCQKNFSYVFSVMVGVDVKGWRLERHVVGLRRGVYGNMWPRHQQLCPAYIGGWWGDTAIDTHAIPWWENYVTWCNCHVFVAISPHADGKMWWSPSVRVGRIFVSLDGGKAIVSQGIQCWAKLCWLLKAERSFSLIWEKTPL